MRGAGDRTGLEAGGEAVMAARKWWAACFLVRLFRCFAARKILRLAVALGVVVIVADCLGAGGECGPVVACTVS